MHTFANVILVTSVACCCVATRPHAAQSDHQSAVAERLEFYEVPLMCAAARGLGCGSRAKPVLLALERDAAVDEAWLDRAGRTLAIMWKASTARAAAAAAIPRSRPPRNRVGAQPAARSEGEPRSSAWTMLKMAVLAPMPSASAAMAVTVNPGARISRRSP